MIRLPVNVIIFFSAVSMAIQKPVSPENDHFNLNFYISRFIFTNVLNTTIKYHNKIIFVFISIVQFRKVTLYIYIFSLI